jgi:hypothetical protein
VVAAVKLDAWQILQSPAVEAPDHFGAIDPALWQSAQMLCRAE